jgi:hypothetical protein
MDTQETITEPFDYYKWEIGELLHQVYPMLGRTSIDLPGIANMLGFFPSDLKDILLVKTSILKRNEAERKLMWNSPYAPNNPTLIEEVLCAYTPYMVDIMKTRYAQFFCALTYVYEATQAQQFSINEFTRYLPYSQSTANKILTSMGAIKQKSKTDVPKIIWQWMPETSPNQSLVIAFAKRTRNPWTFTFTKKFRKKRTSRNDVKAFTPRRHDVVISYSTKYQMAQRYLGMIQSSIIAGSFNLVNMGSRLGGMNDAQISVMLSRKHLNVAKYEHRTWTWIGGDIDEPLIKKTVQLIPHPWFILWTKHPEILDLHHTASPQKELSLEPNTAEQVHAFIQAIEHQTDIVRRFNERLETFLERQNVLLNTLSETITLLRQEVRRQGTIPIAPKILSS